MDKHRDVLAEALAQLKQEAVSTPVPEDVMNETIQRLARCEGMRSVGPPARRRRIVAWRAIKLTAAAAAVLIVGYAIGARSTPPPPDLEQLHDALAPSLAAALEPAIRQQLAQEMTQRYQRALVATYVRVKEELTQQYREDLNRFAAQTLAASNAVTNQLLAELVVSMREAQEQDLSRVAWALHDLDSKRRQDTTHLVAGLQTLAYHTEDQFERTKEDLVRFLVAGQPTGSDAEPFDLHRNPSEKE